MTSDRSNIRAYLAAGLDDPADIERQRKDDVLARLDRFGIDPSGTIALVRRKAKRLTVRQRHS